MKKKLLALLIGAALTTPAFAARYDLVIAGGRVIDSASGRDEIANIGIRDGRIAAIARTPLTGAKTLDAKGLVVTPGFIDLHAHGQDPRSEMYQLLDGVTTSIDMEMGTSPMAAFYDRLRGHALINFGASASYYCVRFEVLSTAHCTGHGTSTNSPNWDTSALTAATTPAQEQAIVDRLNRDVAAGGLGYGVGIEYVPGAGRREIYRIFEAAAAHKAPVFVHVRSRPRDRGPGVPLAVAQEVIADAAATGASLQIVHVASTGLGDVPIILELIHGARAHGIDVTTEAYPYTAGSTSIGSEFFSEGWQERNGVSYDALQWPATGERLTEATFNRYRKEQPGASVIIHVIPPASVEAAMADPLVTIASDGIPWETGGEHPRGAGTFSRVLAVYVREKHVLDLKTALAKMTIMPARRLEKVSAQMARKGRLAVGADADITVFDPAKVKDMATFEKPMQASVGYRYVLVAGKVMVTDGAVTPNLFPGVAIHSGPAL